MKLIIDQNSLGIQIEYDIIMMCYLVLLNILNRMTIK